MLRKLVGYLGKKEVNIVFNYYVNIKYEWIKDLVWKIKL